MSLLLLPVDAPLAPDPGAAADAARAELSKPAYTTQEPSLLQRVSEWILDRIGDLLGRADGSGPGGTVATVIVLVLIGLAAVALWTRLGPRGTRRPDATSVFAHKELTAAEYHAAADAALRDGDLATAVLERFRALVRGCEERGLLVPRPGRTAEEVAADLGALLPDAAAAVHAAATAFGEVRYGGRPATEERHAAVADADRAVRAHRERVGTG